MNSSGIKRGLAAAAISALAVTGIPAIASAATLATQENADSARGITLRTASSGGAVSVANDGTNTTVSLVAGAADTMDGGGAVEYVTFAYFADGATTMDQVHVVNTVTRSSTGEFQTEWTPPIGLTNTNVVVYVSNAAGQPLADDGTVITSNDIATVTAAYTGDNSSNVTVSGTAPTVEIAPASGDIGYFTQPDGGAYPDVATDADRANLAGISGTTSAPNVERSGASLGVRPTGNSFGVGDAAPNGIRQWAGVINVDPAALAGTATTPDQILPVVATVPASGPATRDGQGFGLYAQQIRGVSATSTPADPDSGKADVTVTVVDQNGKPVAGANVVREDANGGTATNSGYTDGLGQVTFENATSGAHSYFVNTTADPVYNTGVDYRTTTTVSASRPEAITFTSKDGTAFDWDEYESGDLSVKVTDASGNALSGQRVFYKWTYAAFTQDGDGEGGSTSEFNGVTDANGKLVIPRPAASDFPTNKANTFGDNKDGGSLTLSAYVNRDGSNPGQDPVDLALDATTLKVGESEAAWDADVSTTRQVGTTQTFGGSLTLADGTALAGRTLDVTYAPGADSSLSTTQPTGTTRLSATSARVVTDANGEYSVSVTDPSSTTPAPETGNLTVKGTATVGSVPNVKNGVGTDTSDSLAVNWVLNASPFAITDVSSDAADSSLGGNTPGRPVTVTFRVTNAQGAGLAGQSVSLETNHGFFTQFAIDTADDPSTAAVADAKHVALTPAATPTEGAAVGAWKNLGDTIDVTTNNEGYAQVTVAIEGDEGFNDDGAVTSLITATAGSITSNDPNSDKIAVNWTSANPLNPGELMVAQSAAKEQTVTILPKAPTREGVYYDVQATDQFDNLVIDEPVNIDGDGADVQDEDAPFTGIHTNADDEGPAFSIWADEAGDVTPAGSWTTQETTYTDGNLGTPGFQPSVRVTNTNLTDEGETVNFYETDYAASTYNLVHDTADSVKVGTTVIETYTAVDQEGEPISNAHVEFFRNGPDTQQTGEDNEDGWTDNAGQVSYVFSGTKPGTATIEALITNNPDNGAVVPGSRATDQVLFEGDAVPAKGINLKASGKNNGAKADKLKVNANNNAAGLVAKVFVNGKKVASHKLNSHGNFNFTIKDKNGKKATKYVVKVAKTETTKAGKASKKLK